MKSSGAAFQAPQPCAVDVRNRSGGSVSRQTRVAQDTLRKASCLLQWDLSEVSRGRSLNCHYAEVTHIKSADMLKKAIESAGFIFIHVNAIPANLVSL